MRKLTVGTFLTLDGVMQGPGGPEEDRSGWFNHGGWGVPFFDDMMVQLMTEWIVAADGLLLGRRTIQTLLEHDLIHEYRLWTFPVLLGRGKRLVAEGTVPAGLKLVDTKFSSTGAVLHVYHSAGKLDYGSFALDQPSAAEIERRQRLAGRASLGS